MGIQSVARQKKVTVELPIHLLVRVCQPNFTLLDITKHHRRFTGVNHTELSLARSQLWLPG